MPPPAIATPHEPIACESQPQTRGDPQTDAHRLGDPVVVERVLQEERHPEDQHDRADPQHQASADRFFQAFCPRGSGQRDRVVPGVDLFLRWRWDRRRLCHRWCRLGRRRDLRRRRREGLHRRRGRRWRRDSRFGRLDGSALKAAMLQRVQLCPELAQLPLEARHPRPREDRQHDCEAAGEDEREHAEEDG